MNFLEKIYKYYKKYSFRKIGINIYGDGSNLKIGKDVSFGGNVTIFGTDEVFIGDYTMIALSTIIHTSTHDLNDHPMWSKRIDRPVKIGEHVWIGVGAIILPGVEIGSYSVVAAGAVVTQSYPEFSVIAGNPAIMISRRNVDVSLMKISERKYGEIVKKSLKKL